MYRSQTNRRFVSLLASDTRCRCTPDILPEGRLSVVCRSAQPAGRPSLAPVRRCLFSDHPAYRAKACRNELTTTFGAAALQYSRYSRCELVFVDRRPHTFPGCRRSEEHTSELQS